MAVVDAEGLAALSMRRLSTQLGVEPLSLYHHVRDKQDVVNGLNLLVLSHIDAGLTDAGPSGSGGADGRADDDGWADVVRAFAERLYSAYRQHPDLARVLVRGVPTDPGSLAVVERVLGALARTGLPQRRQVSAFRGLVAMCLGLVLLHAASPDDDRTPREHPWPGWELPAVATPEFPHLRSLSPAFGATPPADDLAFMLELYLGALRRIP
jgi:AcrR family transcriptional regulator